MGLVEFTHSVEALQALVMMKDAKLYSRHLIVCQDRVGPSPVSQTGFTEGLVDVSGESAKMAQMYMLISLKATLSSTAQGAPPYRTHLSHGMRRMTYLQARRYLGE